LHDDVAALEMYGFGVIKLQPNLAFSPLGASRRCGYQRSDHTACDGYDNASGITLDGNRMLGTWKLDLFFFRVFGFLLVTVTAHETSVDQIYGKRDFSARELSTIGGERKPRCR